ncbi:MAG: RHS repeat-associated core domain-containing protein, partial [Arenimonas sp.]
LAAKGFVYDDRNRLRDYKNSGSTVTRTYRYNGKGERVSKVQAVGHANNRYYFYDEAGHLLGEYLANGTRVQEYVWMDDQLVAVLSDHDASTYQFVETDHLGTPRAVVHPVENNIVWRWNITNTAFGEHAASNNPDGDAVTYTFNLRYPGQVFDAESGTHYNYLRDGYEPGTGRYTQSDPAGLRGGISTYSYVYGDPIGMKDPLGLWGDGHTPMDRPCGFIPGKGCSPVPPGPRGSGTIFGGAEVHYVVGWGLTSVSCIDECGKKQTFRYQKVCIGGAAGAGATVGMVGNMNGKKCNSKTYEGYFAELGYTAGLVSGGFDLGFNESDWKIPGTILGCPTGFQV